MEINDRVLVPSYRSWRDDGEPYMVTEEKHLTGKIGKRTPISTGPQYKEYVEGSEFPVTILPPMPGTDYRVWVILDEPLGAQDVIQCRESALVKLEE